MSDRHSIGPGIVVTVVGGLIVAAILGALGKIPSIITGVIAGLLFVLGVSKEEAWEALTGSKLGTEQE